MKKQGQQRDSDKSPVYPNVGSNLGPVINYSYAAFVKQFRDVCTVNPEYAHSAYMSSHPPLSRGFCDILAFQTFLWPVILTIASTFNHKTGRHNSTSTRS